MCRVGGGWLSCHDFSAHVAILVHCTQGRSKEEEGFPPLDRDTVKVLQ